jgi:hypothetical protein
MGYNNTSNMGYNIETSRDTLYDVPSDIKNLRSEILEKEKEKEKEKSRINNLIKKGYMSIKDAIDNNIKIGDKVNVRAQLSILSKGVEGSLTNISLTSGSDPPKATMTISCSDNICKNSQDRFGSNQTNNKSFGDNYKVKVIPSPSSGGKSRKSNRKSRKSNKKSRKSNRKSRKSNRKTKNNF